MKTFYYIARTKPRGRSLRYVGDGIIDAENKTDARNKVAESYRVAKKNVEIRERAQDQKA